MVKVGNSISALLGILIPLLTEYANNTPGDESSKCSGSGAHDLTWRESRLMRDTLCLVWRPRASQILEDSPRHNSIYTNNNRANKHTEEKRA